MEYQHLKTGWRITLPDAESVRQRDVERYVAAYKSLKGDDSQPGYRGNVVRAAVAAGWIKDSVPALPGAVAVDDLPPACVRWLAAKIDGLYKAASDIPPE